MNTALEVKEDGQIWLIPDCPVEPEYTKVAIAANVGAEAINKVMHSLKGDQYREALASAERILVSNQDVAKRLINPSQNLYRPGLYPIPDLKWEPRTVEKFYESKGWFWEKVAVISLPLESTPSTEQQPFNGCSPTACGCKSLADCPNNQPLAVATFVIQEDEKNGMYEEPKKEYILCAAIHWDDGETYPHPPKNITTGLVICGRRHHNILAVKSRVGCAAFQKVQGEQGFVTNTDRFVDREEGLRIAILSGQIDKAKYGNQLYSEDLY